MLSKPDDKQPPPALVTMIHFLIVLPKRWAVPEVTIKIDPVGQYHHIPQAMCRPSQSVELPTTLKKNHTFCFTKFKKKLTL